MPEVASKACTSNYTEQNFPCDTHPGRPGMTPCTGGACCCGCWCTPIHPPPPLPPIIALFPGSACTQPSASAVTQLEKLKHQGITITEAEVFRKLSMELWTTERGIAALPAPGHPGPMGRIIPPGTPPAQPGPMPTPPGEPMPPPVTMPCGENLIPSRRSDGLQLRKGNSKGVSAVVCMSQLWSDIVCNINHG
jgi:hypothetical protein